MTNSGADEVSVALAGIRTESGASLLELAESSPVLLVFLRHFGCSFEYYGLSEVERVNDPEAAVYQLPVFALERKNPLLQAINPVVWAGWFKGAIFKHGIGKIEGDGHQMPGIFFLRGASIVRGFKYRTIADEPDYLKLVA
jgi:hypothetical protein